MTLYGWRSTLTLPGCLGAVIFLGLASHGGYLANGFVWLDHGDLEGGRAVVPLVEVAAAFLKPFGETGFYRPLVTVFNSLDRALYGPWAPGYHATNVLLHLLVVAVAYPFSRAFFSLAREEALIAALVVAVHPLSWLPVGALAYRPELLATLFVLLGLTAYIRLRRGQGTVAWAALALFAALFSKETALPWFVAGVAAWEVSEKKARASPRTSWLVLALVAVSYLGLRVYAVGIGWHLSAPDLSWRQALGTRLAVLWQRLVELVWPLRPELSDATPIVDVLHPASVSCLLALLGAGISWRLVGLSGRRVLLFLGLALAPATNLLPLPRFSSPHYGYFACVGVGAAAASLLRRPVPLAPLLHRRLSAVVATLWVGVMTASTFSGGGRLRDDPRLFIPEVTRDPLFREGHFYLGQAWAENKSDLEKAATAFHAALEEHPNVLAYVDRPAALIDFARVRYYQERYREAEDLLVEAQSVVPGRLRFLVLYNRALVAQALGDSEKVIALLGDHPQTRRWREPARVLARALKRSPPPALAGGPSLGRGSGAVELPRK